MYKSAQKVHIQTKTAKMIIPTNRNLCFSSQLQYCNNLIAVHLSVFYKSK